MSIAQETSPLLPHGPTNDSTIDPIELGMKTSSKSAILDSQNSQWWVNVMGRLQQRPAKPDLRGVLDVVNEEDKWVGAVVPRDRLISAMNSIRGKNHAGYRTCRFWMIAIVLAVPMYAGALVFYILLLLLWALLNCVRQCKACFPPQFDVGSIRTIMGAHLTKSPALVNTADFSAHREPTYLWAATIGLATKFIAYFAGASWYYLMEDDEMLATLLCTSGARDLVLSDDGNKVKASYQDAALSNLELYRGYFLDARQWEYDYIEDRMTMELLDHSPLDSIQSNSRCCTCFTYYLRLCWLHNDLCGQSVKQTVQDSEATQLAGSGVLLRLQDRENFTSAESDGDARLWDLAKAHFAVTFGFWIPSITHNWVHFFFQDISCVEYFNTVSPTSVLGTLMGAHLRFTQFINAQGPSMAIMQPQGQQTICTWCSPWKAIPVTQQHFQARVVKNAASHYIDYGGSEDPLIWNVTGAFPPLFVRERLTRFDEYNAEIQRKIPYLDMLSDYYEVVYAFVFELWTWNLLERPMLQDWQLSIHATPFYKFRDVHPVEALTTLIWTGGIVHNMDHWCHSYLFNLTPFSTMMPFKSAGNGDWRDVLQPSWFSKELWQNAKSRVFWDFFIKYQDSWFCDNRMISPNLYGGWLEANLSVLQREKCRAITDEYRANLATVNQKWSWINPVDNIAASTCY